MRLVRLYILTLLTLCAAASPAAAQTSYAPGTVGYLYEDCRAALQSETADGFINSHCFNFGVGYGFGGLGANWIVPTVKKDDPCQADKNRLYTHLQERFCGNVLKPPPSVIQNPVLTTLHMFFGWVDHLKENGQDDVLQQSVTTALNAMITPGPFCATIDAYAGEKFPYDISPAVRKFATSLLSVRKEVMARTYAAGYEQCKADTAAPDQFRASNCGAEILGYITGINSTRWIQDNRLTATDESCAPAMARIYDSLDVATYRCQREHTEPLLLALAYIRENEARFENAATNSQRFGTISAALPRLRLCTKP